MNKNIGVISMGIKTPIIKEGDNIVDIVVNSVLEATKIGPKFVQPNSNVKGLVEVPGQYNFDINHHDVIGITESVVARAQGNYVTVDEIAEDIKKKFYNPDVIIVDSPIYSRNRFSMILKAIARAAKYEVKIIMPDFDEVGNPRGKNPFTGVNIAEYYKEICEKEGKRFEMINPYSSYSVERGGKIGVLYCGLHDYKEWLSNNQTLSLDKTKLTLANICDDKCEYGLLGSNKATEEKLKLFPNKVKAQKVVEEIQEKIADWTGRIVEVMIFGDGCFHSPSNGKSGSSIWEFADPVVSPAYTSGLDGYPNEIKIKAFADDKYKNLSGKELNEAIKNEIRSKENNLIGSMTSQGTTPRHFTWLLGSLMDLTTGSGDKGTPVVLVKNYFNNFAS